MLDSPASSLPTVHVCIATGQNAANLIPLEQLIAQEVWILQTPAMLSNAKNLLTALKKEGRKIECINFDDASPKSIEQSAQSIAERLDGRQVILHATGGTKLMVLALRDELRLVETGAGALEVLYAETHKQQIDWLGANARSEPMGDVLDLRQMLLVQGYRIDGDSRHKAAQQRAQTRASFTRELGDGAGRYGKFFSTFAALASRASDGNSASELTQFLSYAPGGEFASLIRKAETAELLKWDGEEAISFTSTDTARYLSGGWLEEFVLLKLTGGLAKPTHFSSNLQIISIDKGVQNEIDAILVHRNRALLIECKTGRQTKAQDSIYKLAQLKDRLGGSVGGALYLSAQNIRDEIRERAKEYKVDVLAGAELSKLVAWLKDWQTR